jgi:hypothetical protein
MSFEYRELTAQVFANAGEGDQPPCQGETCPNNTRKIQCCATCGTTTKGCDTNTCNAPRPPHPPEHEHRKTLGMLHQQLRDALTAG